MTDIVERLQEYRRNWKTDDELIIAAEDEILRLRTAELRAKLTAAISAAIRARAEKEPT